MKRAPLCLVLALVLTLTAGCRSRSSDENMMDVTSTPEEAGEQSTDLEEDSRQEDSNGEQGAELVEEELSSQNQDGSSENADEESSRPTDGMDMESKAAMSMDFTEISALDGEKLGWGSGGPTDGSGRPNGATLYQQKYGAYDAYFIAPENNNVYLTFDEGYENGFTPSILDTLKEKEVTAVFFITLDFAQRQPELVQRMIDEGHVVGNHSCKHLSFPDMTLEDAEADIMQLHNYVQDNFFYEMHLFRPPMGEFSEQTLALAQSLGYKSVFWSFAYKDYDVDNQPLTIEALDGIVSKAHPGSIYLLHAVSQTNAEVLGSAIDQIQEKGYTFARFDW